MTTTTVLCFYQTLLLSLTNRCGSKQPEYESPTEHNTEFHPIINNPDNTNLYDTVNESSRSEVDISPKSDEQVQQNQQEQQEQSQNEAKESVKGTPFDSEVEEEEDVQEKEIEKNNEETNKTSEVEENQKSGELPVKDDEIEDTMQNSSSFAEITFRGH